MEKAGILVNQECFEISNEKLAKLKSTFVTNIKCFVQSGSFTECQNVILQNGNDSNCICEGDTVVVELKFYGDEKEVLELKLFEGECDILNDEISVNSPLGKAIYHQPVGTTTSYLLNDNRVGVKILKKLT